jgi:hypothetical protein
MISAIAGKDRSASISPLQEQAWTIANQGYHEPGGDAYRALARELYEEDLHESILALFARLDEQNALLDAALAMARACPQQGGQETAVTKPLDDSTDGAP